MAKLHNIIYSDVIEVLYCPFWSHGAVYVGGGSLLVNIRWGGGVTLVIGDWRQPHKRPLQSVTLLEADRWFKHRQTIFHCKAFGLFTFPFSSPNREAQQKRHLEFTELQRELSLSQREQEHFARELEEAQAATQVGVIQQNMARHFNFLIGFLSIKFTCCSGHGFNSIQISELFLTLC